ncbi:hypothetical protein D3C76_1799610 [compost metagenome]
MACGQHQGEMIVEEGIAFQSGMVDNRCHQPEIHFIFPNQLHDFMGFAGDGLNIRMRVIPVE